MQSRLPTILGKAIEDATRTLNEESLEERVVDLSECIERMEKLMVDLSGNAELRPILDDGEADVTLWNKELTKYFRGKWVGFGFLVAAAVLRCFQSGSSHLLYICLQGKTL